MRRAHDLRCGEAVEIEVSDSGAGLSPALLGALSQPFAQLSRSSRRRYRGVGLGLAVVRHNVEVLGGSIRLRSTPGHGATFLVRLPARGWGAGLGVRRRGEPSPARRAAGPTRRRKSAVANVAR
jgi:signal transduction histidine kinase